MLSVSCTCLRKNPPIWGSTTYPKLTLTFLICTSNSYTYCFFMKDSLLQKTESISVQGLIRSQHHFLRTLPSGSRQYVPSEAMHLLGAKPIYQKGIGSSGNPQAKQSAATYTVNHVNPNWPLQNLTFQRCFSLWFVLLKYLQKKGLLSLLTNHNKVTSCFV